MSAATTDAVSTSDSIKTEQNENVQVSIKLPVLSIPRHHHHNNNDTKGKKSNRNHKASSTTADNTKKNELLFQFNKDVKIRTVVDVLAISEQSKYLTNIQLTHNGKILSEEATLGESLANNNDKVAKLNVSLKPYTTRSGLHHLLTVRDFVGFSSESIDGLSEFAISTHSKFNSLPLDDIKEKKIPIEEKKDQEKEEGTKEEEPKKKNVFEVNDEEKSKFASMVHEIFEASANSSINKLLSAETDIITPCLRSLSLSGYNPVPVFYKSKGHLFYIQVVTLESETFHITVTPSGFFVNKSSATKFDPNEKIFEEEDNKTQIKSGTFYTLYDLLAYHSKKFTSHVEALEKKLSNLESVSYVKPLTTFLHKPWMVSSPTNPSDFLRLQLTSQDLSPITKSNDTTFNDQYQAIKDLPLDSIPNRIEFEKLQTKITHDFTIAAIKGAMSIFTNDSIPLNPESVTNEHIYLIDDIFYSFADKVSNKDLIVDEETARVSATQDLKTINVLNRVKLDQVRYVLTTIVDFAGKRLIAQTPVPGLLSSMGAKLEKDPVTDETILKDFKNDVMVQYGLDEEEGKILYDEEFDAALGAEFAKIFHLQKHHAKVSADDDDNKIWFSSKSRGLIGFDKRKYVLDLANTYPIDINFVKEHFDSFKGDTSRRYPHRQTLLRPELVDKWWTEKVEKEDGLDMVTAFNENKFNYNPDAYHIEGVEDKTIDNMSTYLNDDIIPNVMKDYFEGKANIPYNGEHLVDTLHKHGINLRYLGKIIEITKEYLESENTKHSAKLEEVAKDNADYEDWEASYLMKIEKMIAERQAKINKYVQEGKEVPPELTGDLKLNEDELRKPTNEEPVIVAKDELETLIHVAEVEVISRSIKHFLRAFAKPLPVALVPSLISFVFNLLFGEQYNADPKPEEVNEFYPTKSYEFVNLTRASILEFIQKEAFLRFRYELPENWINKHTGNPFQLIRSICYKFGIQLINKEYFLRREQYEYYKQSQDKKIRNKLVEPTTTFAVNDFVIIPKVKTSECTSLIAQEYWQQGLSLINEDQTTALTSFAQSIAVLEEVNSVLHPTVAEKYLALSTIYNQLGLSSEAVAFCRKSCKIYERVCGIDSFEMLRAMINLTLSEISNESPYNASVIYKRIISTLQAFQIGSDQYVHPSITNIYTSLEQLSLGVENPKLTIEILKKLSDLISTSVGDDSLAYAYTGSRLSNMYVTLKEYRHGLEHVVMAEKVFTKELGANHVQTAQAKQWVTGLTNLLNNIQNKINEEQKQVQESHQSKAKASSTGSSSSNNNSHSKKNKKNNEPNPELAKKSVDELLDFIEGDSGKKSKKNKKNGKK
ncbi:translation initiation factor 3 subunit CLU1 NDAI_0B01590 [Naumovozyma dairenensis CBS 421]|uniref:Clu domain-containing protein n=1 Tax=Naumovozyma dairenensis (strain ATCC 10597 / BCRC 20456 / CBS 421 / NBRC 0211 / NRRL Y-12639) TaxID=1071378 RepID=G0W5Y2_NAUDC|nr:hypothetical protein NDAI_0B01590 [Naumovozyma dairenensis CBS 421]CCD23193.1 hypothetical protein NDAI_0B01590 [Naumovozyma dairenensis CBS 421]